MLEEAVLAPEPAQLLALFGGKAFPLAGVDLGGLSHFLRDSADTPSSGAASEIGLAEERRSRTASGRNSGGYGGLVLGTSSPLRGRSSPSLYLSTDV